MTKLLRVDCRLLHGQVVFSRTQGLRADCILITNDDVPKNDIRKTTIRPARPIGVELIIKTIEDAIVAPRSSVTEKCKLFIVAESVEDAHRLATTYPEIKEINLGGMKVRKNTRSISKTISITPDEEKVAKELAANDCEVGIRQALNGRKVAVLDALQKGEIKMIGQATLLDYIVFIAQSGYALGTSLPSRPIITSLFIGVILGDVKTGVIMDATLELAFVDSFSVGALILPDIVTGGISGTASATTAGIGTKTVLVLGLSIAMLTSILKNIYLGLLIPIMSQKADQYAEEGAHKGVECVHSLVGFGLSFMLALVITISLAMGSNTIKGLLDLIPEFIRHGLSVAMGTIPVLGSTVPAYLLINKQVTPYLLLGFVSMVYFRSPVIEVAILGVITTVIVVSIMNHAKGKNETIQTTSRGTTDDDEGF